MCTGNMCIMCADQRRTNTMPTKIRAQSVAHHKVATQTTAKVSTTQTIVNVSTTHFPCIEVVRVVQ